MLAVKMSMRLSWSRKVLWIVQSKHAGERMSDKIEWTRRELAPVAGWEPLTQPEGAMIFYQPYKVRLTPATSTRVYSNYIPESFH